MKSDVVSCDMERDCDDHSDEIGFGKMSATIL
jgi:hypothetical protein